MMVVSWGRHTWSTGPHAIRSLFGVSEMADRNKNGKIRSSCLATDTVKNLWALCDVGEMGSYMFILENYILKGSKTSICSSGMCRVYWPEVGYNLMKAFKREIDKQRKIMNMFGKENPRNQLIQSHLCGVTFVLSSQILACTLKDAFTSI